MLFGIFMQAAETAEVHYTATNGTQTITIVPTTHYGPGEALCPMPKEGDKVHIESSGYTKHDPRIIQESRLRTWNPIGLDDVSMDQNALMRMRMMYGDQASKPIIEGSIQHLTPIEKTALGGTMMQCLIQEQIQRLQELALQGATQDQVQGFLEKCINDNTLSLPEENQENLNQKLFSALAENLDDQICRELIALHKKLVSESTRSESFKYNAQLKEFRMAELLTERNRKWVDYIMQQLGETPNVYLAVGSGHIPSFYEEDSEEPLVPGLLYLLKKNGYTVHKHTALNDTEEMTEVDPAVRTEAELDQGMPQVEIFQNFFRRNPNALFGILQGHFERLGKLVIPGRP